MILQSSFVKVNADLIDMRGAVLKGVRWDESSMRETLALGTRFAKVSFRDCDLKNANFWGAHLSEVDFSAELALQFMQPNYADFRRDGSSENQFVDNFIFAKDLVGLGRISYSQMFKFVEEVELIELGNSSEPWTALVGGASGLEQYLESVESNQAYLASPIRIKGCQGDQARCTLGPY